MSTQSYEQLIAGANKIRENELPESNTHTLVGEQMLQMVNKQQEADDQCKSEVYNVSRYHTQVDGSRIFTLAQAIDVVPARLRISGAVIKFKTSTKEVIAFFDGDIANWSNVNLWRTVIDNKEFESAEKTGNKDQPGGYAGLDENGLVPTSSLSPNPLETESQNIVGAINELQTGKVDSGSIVQELGDSDKLVLSQKAAKELLQTSGEKNKAKGYVGLDSDSLIDNRQFRKTNGYIFKSGASIPLNPPMDFSKSDFTFEIIFNQKVSATDWLFLQQTGTTYLGVSIGSNKNLIAHPGIVGYIIGIINQNVDYHLIYSKIGDKYSIYLNGEKVSEVVSAGLTYPSPSEQLTIAKYMSLASNLAVTLFRIFNRGFSQEDVAYYWNDGRPDKARLLYSDTSINTSELLSGGDFESGLIGVKTDDAGSSSTWTLNNVSPISGTQDGRLVVTTGASSSTTALTLRFTPILMSGRRYKISFKYKLNSGIIDDKISMWDGAARLVISSLPNYTKTSDTISFDINVVNNYVTILYFNTYNNNLIDIQIDNISIKEVGSVLELLPENATPATWLGTQQNVNGVISGSPVIYYGDFYKKEVPIVDEPSYIEFEKTGDGTGIASVTVNCYTSNVATITGGEFFTDATGTTSLGGSVQMFAGLDKVLYWKATDQVGSITMSNVDIFKAIVDPTNSPKIVSTITDINARNRFGGLSSGSSSISGNTRDFGRKLTHIIYGGTSVISGSVIDLPRSLTYISFGGSHAISGLFKNVPRKLTLFQVHSSGNNIGGNIADIPNQCTFIYITKGATGGTQYSYTSGHIFPSQFDTFFIRPYSTGELTATMIDNIFIDLNASVTTAIGGKTLDLRGNCAAPTAASLAARNELAAKGFTIYIN